MVWAAGGVEKRTRLERPFPGRTRMVHFLGRYRWGSSKKSIARNPALNEAEWGTPAGTKYSSPRRQVRVTPSIVSCISPSTTIPHWAPWVCSGTVESARAWNNVADAVLACRSHNVTPWRGVSPSGNFRMNLGNPFMDGEFASAVWRPRPAKGKAGHVVNKYG